jgi:hypothetical protein
VGLMADFLALLFTAALIGASWATMTAIYGG